MSLVLGGKIGCEAMATAATTTTTRATTTTTTRTTTTRTTMMTTRTTMMTILSPATTFFLINFSQPNELSVPELIRLRLQGQQQGQQEAMNALAVLMPRIVEQQVTLWK